MESDEEGVVPAFLLQTALARQGTGKRQIRPKRIHEALVIDGDGSDDEDPDFDELGAAGGGNKPKKLSKGKSCTNMSSSQNDQEIEENANSGSGDGDESDDYTDCSDNDNEQGSNAATSSSSESSIDSGNESPGPIATVPRTDGIKKQVDESREILKIIRDDLSLKLKPAMKICSACLGAGDEMDGNKIMECNSCGQTVHKYCYYPKLPVPKGYVEPTQWDCDYCRKEHRSAKTSRPHPPICAVCPIKTGLLKETCQGSYIHLICALYIPGLGLETKTNLYNIPEPQFDPEKACVLCEDAGKEVTIKCNVVECEKYFHATCGQKHGILFGPKTDSEYVNPYFGRCKRHATKTDIKRRSVLFKILQEQIRMVGRRALIPDEAECFNTVGLGRMNISKIDFVLPGNMEEFIESSQNRDEQIRDHNLELKVNTAKNQSKWKKMVELTSELESHKVSELAIVEQKWSTLNKYKGLKDTLLFIARERDKPKIDGRLKRLDSLIPSLSGVSQLQVTSSQLRQESNHDESSTQEASEAASTGTGTQSLNVKVSNL